MSQGSDSLYTRQSRFTLNQLFGYQDADEMRENMNRLRDAFADQHAWGSASDEQLDNVEWALAYPNWDLGAHVGDIGVAGYTNFIGDGSQIVNLAKGALGNACQVLPTTLYFTPNFNYPAQFPSPGPNTMPFSAIASWGHIKTLWIQGGYSPTSIGRIQPGVWYYNNVATAHQFIGNFPTPDMYYNEGLSSPFLGQKWAPIYVPSAMYGGKFHFRLKCLIHVYSASQFGANWNSISGSTIEILPSLYGIDGTIYDAPNPAGLAIITDPFNGAGQYFFMAEWNFEWDLAGTPAPTQPYDLWFKARFNTSATIGNLGVQGMAILALGRGTEHVSGSQTPPHLGGLPWLYSQLRAFGGASNIMVSAHPSNMSLNRLKLWTTET